MNKPKAKYMPHMGSEIPRVKKASVERAAIDIMAFRFIHECVYKGVVDETELHAAKGVQSGAFWLMFGQVIDLAIHANALNPDEKSIVAFKETFEKVLGVKPRL